MSASKWTNEFLDSMRLTGDILADPVAEIIWKKRNRPVMADLRFLSTNFENPLSKNVAIISQDLGLDDMEKQVITEYFNHFENLGRLYSSCDLKDFEVSSQLFNRYGYLFTSLLFFKSLPGGYMCPNPAFVLHSTKLLEDFAARRVMETAQFVFAVNTPDWYQSGSRGLMAIERVRLMHAGMRVSLLQQKEPGKEWNLSKGTPINQEDLTLTNHLFSLAVIDGLDAMGVHLSEEERRSIFNTWQKIGAAMGVSEFMLNSSYDDARSQYKKILKRALNLNKDDLRETLEELRQQCPEYADVKEGECPFPMPDIAEKLVNSRGYEFVVMEGSYSHNAKTLETEMHVEKKIEDTSVGEDEGDDDGYQLPPYNH